MAITPAASVLEFFYEAVKTALRSQDVHASELTEYYLVNLLAEFSHEGIDEEPLILRLAEALSESPEERARGLRHIGDTALYVSGFFGESIERRLGGTDYYLSLGESAYEALAGLLRMSRGSDRWCGVYGELAEKFARFVDVLAEVSERSSLGTNQGVLRLYERWVRTHSARMEEKLRECGLLPSRGGTRH